MILLQKSDFNTFFKLAQTTATDPVLQAYIDRYEKKYILELLGVTYGTAWITAIAGTPSAADLAVKNEFYEQDDDGTIYHSRGIKDFVAAAVYYHYVFDTDHLHSQSGVTHPQAETSYVVDFANQARAAEQKWNTDALDTAEAIKWYCEDNDDYPTFEGKAFKPRFSALI